jgi:hypothetical protein
VAKARVANEFTREGRELNEREAAKLEARMRGEGGTPGASRR